MSAPPSALRRQPRPKERALPDQRGPWFQRSRVDTQVTNPASGARLAVCITYPRETGRRPLLVLAPGGLSAGSLSFGVSGIADRYASRGFVVAHFDPDGRGSSEGHEDFCGPIHQEGLAAVVSEAAAHVSVDPERIAVVSFCLGGIAAAGALARHPELPVRLYVDWEGPALRRHALRVISTRTEGVEPPRPDDEDWWGEREAMTLIRRVRVPYQRVQSSPDHAQPAADHALDMVCNATRPQHGGHGQSPWTRLNGKLPNRCHDLESAGTFLPVIPAEVAVLAYLAELLPAAG